MQLAGPADHRFAIQKTPQPAMAAGFFVMGINLSLETQGLDAIAFSIAAISFGSSGVVVLGKLATT